MVGVVGSNPIAPTNSSRPGGIAIICTYIALINCIGGHTPESESVYPAFTGSYRADIIRHRV